MRNTVAKRLRKMTLIITGKKANDSVLIHNGPRRLDSGSHNPKYYSAILSPACGRAHYQDAKKNWRARHD